jgi:Protein tyrosine and serine/threonine kinase
MSKHYLRGETKDCRYAIKMLNKSNKQDASTYINGVVDLAVEVRFLSVLHHSNIIKMRAVAACSPFDIDSKYFIILDRLYDTLIQRLTKWRNQQPIGIGSLCYRSSKKERRQFLERLTFAYDLACALKYLHEQK